MNEVALGAIWYAVLLLSLTVHEAAHGLAALRGGDETAYLGGQVTLDPRPHIGREPLGMVVFPIFFYAMGGFMIGWASTPIDPRWAFAHPRRAAWMSLAGPGANLALFVLAGLAIKLGVEAGVFYPPGRINFSSVTAAVAPGAWEGVAVLLSIAFSLNLLLAVFNLLPVPPLDGSGVVALVLGDDTARRYQAFISQPGFSAIGILVAWFAIRPIFGPIQLMAVNLLYPGVTYG